MQTESQKTKKEGEKMSESNKKVLMNARIDANLREEFRIKTIREKTTMAEVVEDLIRGYVENK